MNIIKKVGIYGDSILKGVMLDKQSNRYYIGQKDDVDKITKELPIDIDNKSKFGCTITKGYSILKRDLDKGTVCDFAVLEYGGNDCDFNWQEVSDAPEIDHLPHTDLNTFKVTYKNMIKDLKEKGIMPIITSLPPIDAERYINFICKKGLNKENIVKWLGDVQMIYRFQELYSKTVEKIAEECNCIFVDVRENFLARRDFKNLLCDDGIHPNEKGHEVITEAFLQCGNKIKSGLTIYGEIKLES